MKSKIIVSLTGGLGNQLFQLAAGISTARDQNVILISAFGKPRENVNQEPEILSFVLPQNVFFVPKKNINKIFIKTVGYLLRIGVNPRKFETSKLYSMITRGMGSTLISFYFKNITIICNGKGTGYFPVRASIFNTLLVGYFQSFRWVNETSVRKNMMRIKLKNVGGNYQKFHEIAEFENPLIVHVRLGDYLTEINFGVPSREYYEQAIDKVLSRSGCKSIWVFSDDINSAKNFIPEKFSIPIRFVGEVDSSTAATFETMRLGSGYVLANSSFSWWAAYLAKKGDVPVAVPDPWFSNLAEPIDLIPDSWIRFPAKFNNHNSI
jgi:hypothetical protein